MTPAQVHRLVGSQPFLGGATQETLRSDAEHGFGIGADLLHDHPGWMQREQHAVRLDCARDVDGLAGALIQLWQDRAPSRRSCQDLPLLQPDLEQAKRVGGGLLRLIGAVVVS